MLIVHPNVLQKSRIYTLTMQGAEYLHKNDQQHLLHTVTHLHGTHSNTSTQTKIADKT